MKTPAELRALHRQFHAKESADEQTLRHLVMDAAQRLDLDATDHLTSTLLLATLGDLLDRLGNQSVGDGQDKAEPAEPSDPVAQHVLAAAAIARRISQAAAAA
jgi:hypothetical protein